MIGFAPLEGDEPPRVRMRSQKAAVRFQNEQTECNYLVLFFVVGVLLLAIGDLYKR